MRPRAGPDGAARGEGAWASLPSRSSPRSITLSTTSTMCWSSRRRTAGAWRRKIRQNPRQLAVYRVVVGIAGLLLICLRIRQRADPRTGRNSPGAAGPRDLVERVQVGAPADALVQGCSCAASRPGRGASRSLFWACFVACCGLLGLHVHAGRRDPGLGACPRRSAAAAASRRLARVTPQRRAPYAGASDVCARGGRSSPLAHECPCGRVRVLRCPVRRLRPPWRCHLPPQPAPGEQPARLRRGCRSSATAIWRPMSTPPRTGCCWPSTTRCSIASPTVVGAIAELPYAEVAEARIHGIDPIPRLADLLDGVSRRPVQHRRQGRHGGRPAGRRDRRARRVRAGLCRFLQDPRRLHRLRRRLGRRVASAASPPAWRRTDSYPG